MASNVDTGGRWKALLAAANERGGQYDQLLDAMRHRAGESGTGASELVLAGRDEALAAIAVARGPEACRPFMETASAIIVRSGRKLAVAPDSIDALSTLTMLSITSLARTIGMDPATPAFDVDRQIDRVLVNRAMSKADRIALAFLSLEHGRPKDVRPIVSEAPPKTDAAADPVALISTLAALKPKAPAGDLETQWDRFVRGFPAALETGTAEWRHLMLAASIVLPRIGRAAVGQVAETMHREALTLAGESS